MYENKPSTREIIIKSFFVNIIMFMIVGGTVFIYKEKIFNYFGQKYMEDVRNRLDKGLSMEIPLTYEARVESAVKKANPAVVSIIISKDVPIIEQYYENVNPFPSIPGFPDDFFGGGFNFQIPAYRQKGTQKKDVGGGSGFLVSKDGLIVTNNHVVSDKQASYTVFTNDGKKHNVTVVATDPGLDVAILRIEGDNFPYLSFGNSDNLLLGQSVIAIGNALGEFRNSVSVGAISGLSRSIIAGDATGKSKSLDLVIQTDAAINPGNSGGPLIDLNGNVVGVNVAVILGSDNIGFSLPGNIVHAAVTSVERTGKIERPYVGIRYVLITEAIKEKNKLSVDYGILISRGENKNDEAVMAGSPAYKAGIMEGDVILQINGEKIDNSKSFSAIVRKNNVGDTITLELMRNEEEKTVRLTLEKFPEK